MFCEKNQGEKKLTQAERVLQVAFGGSRIFNEN
jgi:hypothetical protein